MSLTIEAVTPKIVGSEGPFWDVDAQCLYFADVYGKAICRYVPETNIHTRGSMPDGDTNNWRVAFVIPIKDQEHKFIVGYGPIVVEIKWNCVSEMVEVLETIVDLNTVEDTAECNDAKVDSNGYLWVGYYIPATEGFSKLKAGGLCTVDLSNRTLKKQINGGISLANGMAWNKNNNKYYFADSFENELMEFDCNLDSLEITNRRIVFKSDAGFPDGVTIDVNDDLWIATFAKKVVKVDPTRPNIVLETVELPAHQITSCTFGGINLDELYVTSASVEWEGIKPDGGSVFRVKGLNVQGVACHKAIIN